jgi:heme-degrading monooxygenase HmoA
MIYEVVVSEVAPARRAEYLEAYKRAWRESNPPGCHGVRLMACIEDPARVMTLIAWDSVEAHERARERPEHARFREAIAAFRTGTGGGLAHYTFEDIAPPDWT